MHRKALCRPRPHRPDVAHGAASLGCEMLSVEPDSCLAVCEAMVLVAYQVFPNFEPDYRRVRDGMIEECLDRANSRLGECSESDAVSSVVAWA